MKPSKSRGRTHQTIYASDKMKIRSLVLLTIFFIVLGPALGGAYAAESPATRKVRMAFTSLSSSMCPPWIAREAGIFNKHGLDVEVIATPTGVEGMNALIAGEVQFLQISGGTTASAALGGADVMVVGTTLESLVQQLIARPEVEKAEQLKGKTLGITRFGTSIDVGARLALRHLGLMPEKDVAIVQVGGMESMVAALQGNRIQAGILSYPAITQALKLGHHALLDVACIARCRRAGNSLCVHRHNYARSFDSRGPRSGAPLRDGANRSDRARQTRQTFCAQGDEQVSTHSESGGAGRIVRRRRAEIHAQSPTHHRRSDEVGFGRSRRQNSQGKRQRGKKIFR